MALKKLNTYESIKFTLAEKYAEAWQDQNDLKAFLFHRNDIECVLSEKNAIAVRFYMGLKVEGEKKCPDMMVVGVDDNNLDVINRKENPTEQEPSGVYNFTIPCPRTCDELSDLYFHTGPGTIGSETCAIPAEGRTISTKTQCNIAGYQLLRDTAETATGEWQALFDLKSVRFEKEDLTEIFTQYNVDQIRVYFGLDLDNTERVIIVGVDANDKDVFKEDAAGKKEDLYINSNSLCTKTSVTTCDQTSWLYHTV